MKKQLIAILMAAAVVPAIMNAEIVLTEDLSVSGYLDIYYSDIDLPGDNSSSGVNEFELDFSFTTDPFFSVVELSYDGTDVGFETAIVGYNITEELSVSVGNILSYLGWESYDATGLYQFSYAYRGFSPLYPAYAVGASLDYVTDAFSLGVWVGDSDDGDISYELMGKFTGVEGLTLFAAWADDPYYETINFWASYEVAGFTFALEYVDVDNEFMEDSTGYLAMINYAWESAALTLRYSIEETDGYADDWELITISPSYAFSDNLLGLLELSLIQDGAYMGEEDPDYMFAAELIYTF